MDRRVILIGCGHSHLHVVQNADQLRKQGAAVTLIDPGAFWYSGLATGMLGGQYSPEQDQIQPQPLAEAHGVEHRKDRLVRLDPVERLATLASGETLSFDAISLNLGSEAITAGIHGAAEHAWLVKPIANLWKLRQSLEQRFADQRDGPQPGQPINALVIGGGPTACELAANLTELARRCGGQIHVTLTTRDPRLLIDQPNPAAGKARAMLERRGVSLHFNMPIARVGPDFAEAENGQRFQADPIVLAIGLKPPQMTRDLGLPLAENSGIRIHDTLQTVGDAHVFAVGDCAALETRDLPMLGVFGVREAPILLNNLKAYLADQPLESYKPQKKWLSILNLGRGKALALRAGHHCSGRAAMAWKDRLDRKFLAKYQRG